MLLKIKEGSGSMCKYKKLQLLHSCEIFLPVHDGNHELEEFPTKIIKDEL